MMNRYVHVSKIFGLKGIICISCNPQKLFVDNRSTRKEPIGESRVWDVFSVRSMVCVGANVNEKINARDYMECIIWDT